MGYNELEIELRKILAQIQRWREMGFIPTIEQGIALSRLQKIYTDLMDIPTEDLAEEALAAEPENTNEETEDNHANSIKEPMPIEWDRSDDEEAIIEEIDDEEDKEEDRESEETGGGEIVYVAPDDESFDEENAKESELENKPGKADDDGNFADMGVEDENRQSQEAHLRQEDGAKDVCPNQESEYVEEVKKVVADEKEKKVKVEILGVPVSGYAKQEIINNLFHGNVPLFEEEEKKFNTMASLDEALVYIGETYHWIPENAATIKFIDILETRFKE